MFEDRPYRQPGSGWSIWWFVGLMAVGLTAWHLELLPWSRTPSNQIATSEENMEEFLDGFPEETEASTGSEAESITGPVDKFGKVPEPPAQEEPEQLEVDEAFQSLQTAETISTPVADEQTVELTSHEVPVQTLPYRTGKSDLNVQALPFRGHQPPVQPAAAQEEPQSSPIRTASATIPAEQEAVISDAVPARQEPNRLPRDHELSAQSEQDVLRLRELSTRFWQSPEIRDQFRNEMDALAYKIYFSHETHYLPPHQVEPNQQLATIAKQYDVPWQYLASLNRIQPEALKAGEEIKVIQGPFDAVVELSNYRLIVHAHGYVVASFPIGIGQEGSTPLGQFAVLNKQENPTYYGPNEVISCDDPRNPLGEFWIDLGDSIGIHGTNDPDSIGKAESKGCVRMRHNDIAQVYNLLTTKSRVAIRP